MFVSNMAELFSYIFSGFFLTRLSLKQNFLLFYFMAGVGGFGTLFYGLENPNWTFTIWIMLMKFGLCAASNVCYIGTPRVFPTMFGVTAFGIVSLCSRSFDLFAPMVNELSQPLPMVIYCVTTTIALFASCFIIEGKTKK